MLRPEVREWGRFAALLAASVGAHLVGAGIAAPPPDPPPAAQAGLSRIEVAASGATAPIRAQAARASLVERARSARREGKLELGAFLLEANAIDAAEEGAPFDHAAAAARYAERVSRLRAALASKPKSGQRHDADGIAGAVAATFEDLRYVGIPGGRMGDTLLSGSGSCDPVSQLVAASLFDAGLGDRAALRSYGGQATGAGHLTAVIDGARGVEHDLVAGTPSRPGGARFAASDLVDAYARAHGLAPPLPGERSAASRELPVTPRTRNFASGYPPNGDEYPGSAPLYGKRAVRRAGPEPASAGPAAPNLLEEPTLCADRLRLAYLDPPVADVEAGGGTVRVDLVRTPVPRDLERISSDLEEIEAARSAVDRDSTAAVVVDACLAGLYDRAAVLFSLAREPGIATRAVQMSRAARERAKTSLDRHRGLGEDMARIVRLELVIETGSRPWVLLFLEDTDALVVQIARDLDGTYGEVLAVAGLIVAPRTRLTGVALAEAMTNKRRIDVMHEIFRAHDHMRPWRSSYALELPPGASGAFARTYGVFRPVAWRLWEVPRPPSEAVTALVEGAAAERLDRATTVALAEYYARNFVGLRLRPSGIEGTRELDRALASSSLPRLADMSEVALSPSEIEAIGAPTGAP